MSVCLYYCFPNLATHKRTQPNHPMNDPHSDSRRQIKETEKRIYKNIWEQYIDNISNILDNKYFDV